MSSAKPKIAVFIDSGNLWASYKELKKVIDFSKFAEFFSKKFKGDIFKIFYYKAYPEIGTREQNTIDRIHNFFTFLKKELEFSVVKKPLKTIYLRDGEGNFVHDQDTGKMKSEEKGNFDVEISIDAMKYSSAYDIAIFITGDSDFLPLISYLRNLGKPKKVFIFSTAGCISRELRTGADGYFDLADCTEIHGNDLRHRNEDI